MQLHGREPKRRYVVLGLTVAPRPPPYFDGLIAARKAGQVGRHVHLGYWDNPPALSSRAHLGEFETAQARLTEQLLELVPLRSGQTVLDVACGFGGTLAAIDAHWNDMRLTGVNIDRRQLALCRDAVAGPTNRLNLVLADACALPFATATFDHVLCVEAMFHFASRRQFLADAARVLRPGGTLVATDIMLWQPPTSAPWDSGTIAAVIRREYGPWPELFVTGPWYDVAACGLLPVAQRDWSGATLPSYRIISPGARPEQSRLPSAGEVFRWMHTNGWLTYHALSFRRRL